MSNIIENIQHALQNDYKIAISGGGTKRHLPRHDMATVFDMTGHTGIVSYEPTELVITVKAGTLVSDVESTLAKQGQFLAFEPPRGLTHATIGGTIATASSGPARPYRGAARDHVLGVTLINGNAERLVFGGQVIKNVAGYDVSRLMCGACGALGVLDEISLKVLPKPKHTATALVDASPEKAQKLLAWLRTKPIPTSGSAYVNGQLCLRFDAASNWLKQHAEFEHTVWVSENDAHHIWHALKERSHSFFQTETPIWRVAVPEQTPWQQDDSSLIEWHGALRWYKGEYPPSEWMKGAKTSHGNVYLVDQQNHQPFENLPEPQRALHQRIKAAFDPKGLINPHIRF